MFEKFTRDKQVNEKQRHEKMTTSITTAVLNKVEKTVKNEIRNSVGSSKCLIKFYLKVTIVKKSNIDEPHHTLIIYY